MCGRYSNTKQAQAKPDNTRIRKIMFDASVFGQRALCDSLGPKPSTT